MSSIESLQSLVKLTHLMNAVKLCDEIPLPRRLLKDIKYECTLPHEIFLDRWFACSPPRSKVLFYWGNGEPHGPGSRKCLDVKRRIPADSSVFYLSEWNTRRCFDAMTEYDFIICFQNERPRRDIGFVLANIIYVKRWKQTADVIIISNYSPETVLGWEKMRIITRSTCVIYEVGQREKSSTDALLDSWFLNPGGKVLYVWGHFNNRACTNIVYRRISHEEDLVHISPSFEVYKPECHVRSYLYPSDSYKYLMVTDFQFVTPLIFLRDNFFESHRIRKGTNIIIFVTLNPEITFESRPEYLDRIYAVKI